MKQPRKTSPYVVNAGNSLSLSRGLFCYPDNYFGATITDPPYDKHTHDRKWTGAKQAARGAKVTFAPMTDEDRYIAAGEITRTTSGWAVVFCEDQAIGEWRDAFTAHGALRWAGCIWTKPNGTPQFRGEGPAQACEHIVVSWCGEGRPAWNGGGKIGHYVCAVSPPNVRRHETEKPLRLMTQLVLDFTRPGDVISDPYLGGGQTGVAARRCGRNIVGWELDAEMAAVAESAISKTREQMSLEAHFKARAGAFGQVPDPTPTPEQTRLF